MDYAYGGNHVKKTRPAFYLEGGEETSASL